MFFKALDNRFRFVIMKSVHSIHGIRSGGLESDALQSAGPNTLVCFLEQLGKKGHNRAGKLPPIRLSFPPPIYVHQEH